MRYILTAAFLVGLTIPIHQSRAAEEKETPITLEKLLQDGKVHRMIIYNGDIRQVRYFPESNLTEKEARVVLAAVQLDPLALASEIRTVPSTDNNGIKPAGFDTGKTDRKVRITIADGEGKEEKIEGKVLRWENGWVTIEREDGIDRIRETKIVRIFELKSDIKPASDEKNK